MLLLPLCVLVNAVNECQNYPNSIQAGSAKGSGSIKFTFMLGRVSSSERYSFIVTAPIAVSTIWTCCHTLISKWARNIMCLGSASTFIHFKSQSREITAWVAISSWNNGENYEDITKVVRRHSKNRLFKLCDHPSVHWQLRLLTVNKENFPTQPSGSREMFWLTTWKITRLLWRIECFSDRQPTYTISINGFIAQHVLRC